MSDDHVFEFDATYEVYYDPSLKGAWPGLAITWNKTYPFFDEIDLRLTQSQPTAHFREWLAAIYCHHTFGVHALLEKYQFHKHSEKLSILERLAPGAGEFLRGFDGGPPDLLVFRPDLSDWWFVEVKGPGEPPTKHQPNVFAQVRERFGKPINKAVVKPIPGVG